MIEYLVNFIFPPQGTEYSILARVKTYYFTADVKKSILCYNNLI